MKARTRRKRGEEVGRVILDGRKGEWHEAHRIEVYHYEIYRHEAYHLEESSKTIQEGAPRSDAYLVGCDHTAYGLSVGTGRKERVRRISGWV